MENIGLYIFNVKQNFVYSILCEPLFTLRSKFWNLGAISSSLGTEVKGD